MTIFAAVFAIKLRSSILGSLQPFEKAAKRWPCLIPFLVSTRKANDALTFVPDADAPELDVDVVRVRRQRRAITLMAHAPKAHAMDALAGLCEVHAHHGSLLNQL
jgi:hypothetical protein